MSFQVCLCLPKTISALLTGVALISPTGDPIFDLSAVCSVSKTCCISSLTTSEFDSYLLSVSSNGVPTSILSLLPTGFHLSPEDSQHPPLLGIAGIFFLLRHPNFAVLLIASYHIISLVRT